MILNPILGKCLRPIFYNSVKNTGSLRPTIKIAKERFELTLDVRQYNKDEIRIKAHPHYVLIEGKQEKTTKQGYIMRQFVRKFKLPSGCIPQKIESKLSPQGVLTISAPRAYCEPNLPCDTVLVPISCGLDEKKAEEEVEEPPKPRGLVNPCANYLKVKPPEKK